MMCQPIYVSFSLSCLVLSCLSAPQIDHLYEGNAMCWCDSVWILEMRCPIKGIIWGNKFRAD